MTPALRDMPVIEAVQNKRGGWSVWLPGSFVKIARSRKGVARIVNREVPGSAIRFVEYKEMT